jgi:hypothetical protein
MLFFETSAISGYNVENAFYTATSQLVEKIKNGTLHVDEVIILILELWDKARK